MKQSNIKNEYYNEDKTLYTIEYNDGLIETNHLNPLFKDKVDLRVFSSGGFEYFRYNNEGEEVYYIDEFGVTWIKNEEGSFEESK